MNEIKYIIVKNMPTSSRQVCLVVRKWPANSICRCMSVSWFMPLVNHAGRREESQQVVKKPQLEKSRHSSKIRLNSNNNFWFLSFLKFQLWKKHNFFVTPCTYLPVLLSSCESCSNENVTAIVYWNRVNLMVNNVHTFKGFYIFYIGL